MLASGTRPGGRQNLGLGDKDRQCFRKQLERGMIERRFKKPVERFQAVFVSEEPAWLCGFECGDPESGKTERQMYSKPKSVKEAPAEVFDRLKGIKLKQSHLSIRRHMVYL
jgi:hypothetical protein